MEIVGIGDGVIGTFRERDLRAVCLRQRDSGHGLVFRPVINAGLLRHCDRDAVRGEICQLREHLAVYMPAAGAGVLNIAFCFRGRADRCGGLIAVCERERKFLHAFLVKFRMDAQRDRALRLVKIVDVKGLNAVCGAGRARHKNRIIAAFNDKVLNIGIIRRRGSQLHLHIHACIERIGYARGIGIFVIIVRAVPVSAEIRRHRDGFLLAAFAAFQRDGTVFVRIADLLIVVSADICRDLRRVGLRRIDAVKSDGITVPDIPDELPVMEPGHAVGDLPRKMCGLAEWRTAAVQLGDVNIIFLLPEHGKAVFRKLHELRCMCRRIAVRDVRQGKISDAVILQRIFRHSGNVNIPRRIAGIILPVF